MKLIIKASLVILVFSIAFCTSSIEIHAQQPTKEALIQTLDEVFPLLESKDYDKALEHFALPARLLADREQVSKGLAKMIENREVSKEGIERLNQDAKFGKASDVFEPDRAAHFAKKMEFDVANAYGFNHEHEGVTAEVLAVWKDGKYKLVRLDDVGKLMPLESAESPEALLKTGLKAESEGKFADAWKNYTKAHQAGLKNPRLTKAFDRLISGLANAGMFSVGVTQESILNKLGEAHQKADLGQNRQRWVYGSWGIDFKSGTLHEIVDLKGATTELFQPTEYVSVGLDGQDWSTQFREKRKGHVIAYAYTEKYTPAWPEQFTIERFLDQPLSADEFAGRLMKLEAKQFPGATHKFITRDDSSFIFASEIPLPKQETSFHRLTRVLKGPKDMHKIAYTLRNAQPPTIETQKKWLKIMQDAELTPVKK